MDFFIRVLFFFSLFLPFLLLSPVTERGNELVGSIRFATREGRFRRDTRRTRNLGGM